MRRAPDWSGHRKGGYAGDGYGIPPPFADSSEDTSFLSLFRSECAERTEACQTDVIPRCTFEPGILNWGLLRNPKKVFLRGHSFGSRTLDEDRPQGKRVQCATMKNVLVTKHTTMTKTP